VRDWQRAFIDSTVSFLFFVEIGEDDGGAFAGEGFGNSERQAPLVGYTGDDASFRRQFDMNLIG